MMRAGGARKPKPDNLSWAEVRESLSQLYGNCEALRVAINGEVVDGVLVSAWSRLTFWGRLRWLVTGKL